MKVIFTDGTDVWPGGNMEHSRELQLRFTAPVWSAANDYSATGLTSASTKTKYITMYDGTRPIWGTEPPKSGVTPTATIQPTPTPLVTPIPVVTETPAPVLIATPSPSSTPNIRRFSITIRTIRISTEIKFRESTG